MQTALHLTQLEVHESEPCLLSSWVGNFFQRHILEDSNAEMDLEERGWEGKDLKCPTTGTSD